MALRRFNHNHLLQLRNVLKIKQTNYSTTFANLNKSQKFLLAAGGILTSGLGVIYALEQSVKASSDVAHPVKFPWSHNGPISSLDIASVRRGYQVYKQICSACHSLKFVAYREMVGTIMTEEEAKAEAADITVLDGPDGEGKMFERPGKLQDYVPKPYPNEEAARHANNGAHPPDLTYITLARNEQEDYIFSLLTGYCEPPAGVTVGDGQHYNPYFQGGAISMAQPIYNEALEYADGTPATASQLAKDVSTFLVWCAQPEHDERKRMLIRAIFYLSITTAACWVWKRNVWSTIKTRKVQYLKKK